MLPALSNFALTHVYVYVLPSNENKHCKTKQSYTLKWPHFGKLSVRKLKFMIIRYNKNGLLVIWGTLSKSLYIKKLTLKIWMVMGIAVMRFLTDN